MAYDQQHLKLTWGFTIDDTDELAVFSLNYALATLLTGAADWLAALDFDTADADGDDLLALAQDLMETSSIRWANYSRLKFIKAAAIGTDGLYLTDPKIREQILGTAGTTANTLPQSTICVSLWSGSGLGSANHGRIYLPHSALPLASGDASAVAGETDAVGAAAKIFVNGVTDLLVTSIGEDCIPMIMSNTSPNPSKEVLFVKVGSVTDTQQRRRRGIPEVYDSRTLA